MIVFFAYDIKSNLRRDRVIKHLHASGFVRIQKSLFLGNITEKKLMKLEIMVIGKINIEEDSVFIFPQCLDDYHNTHFVTKNENHKILDMKVMII